MVKKTAFQEWEERCSKELDFWFSSEGIELRLCLIAQGYEEDVMCKMMALFESGFTINGVTVYKYRKLELQLCLAAQGYRDIPVFESARILKNERNRIFSQGYNVRPEVKRRLKKYYKRPEVKQRTVDYHKKYEQRHEVKQKRKEYYQSDEYKKKKKEYSQTKEYKEKRKKYYKSDKYKEMKRRYYQRPDVKVERKEYYKNRKLMKNETNNN